MGKESFQLHLSALREMILDERKTETFVSLSKELCIHVNEGKSLLKRFVEETKSKEDVKLNVSYIISGVVEGNKAQTTVCSKEKLAHLRGTFKTIFFEHIYSVSRGLPSVDDVSLMAVNKFDDFHLCTGLIKNNLCTRRTKEEIGNLKSHSHPYILVEQKNVNQNPKKVMKQEVTNGVAKIHGTKSEPLLNGEVKSAVKNSKQNHDTNKKAQKGIAGFFNKANSFPKNKTAKDVKENKVETVDKTEKNVEPSSEVINKMDVDEDKSELKIEIAKIETVREIKSKKYSKNKHSTKNEKVEKKRKRVIHVSDSESDEEKNDPFVEETIIKQESDDEIPPTPTPNTVKITSGIINPKKKRKIVDKTYTDEDGYILTKKEDLYESCSDNEDKEIKENEPAIISNQLVVETSPKRETMKPKISKKKSPTPKEKQATLMNFFKKV